MEHKTQLASPHSFISETLFALKAWAFTGKRYFQNLFFRVQKFGVDKLLADAEIISVSETELWNTHDEPSNWILTAGKVQNLRIAVKVLNGLEVPAGRIFSFWKHIGNPNIGKKYVVGREIREGCIVPTIAGGLCQLSNALYDAALKAGFEIVERHKHTKVMPGSLAEVNRDATVKWNYKDLRFKSQHSFRIEAKLTADRLLVKFKSENSKIYITYKKSEDKIPVAKLNDCYSCGNIECFKHPSGRPIDRETAITAYILDEKWPEYEMYIKRGTCERDFFIVPVTNYRHVKSDQYKWSILNTEKTLTLTHQALKRFLLMRLSSKANTFELRLRMDKSIAKAAASKIPLACTHLVVSQNLLPYLWEAGAMGGRTFDVLMTRLPIEKLHEQLDKAYARYPTSGTLNDFRASQQLVDLENTALTHAMHVISPHNEIAGLFNNKIIRLDWVLPKTNQVVSVPGQRILFPASSLGRKGAYEVKKLAGELNLQVVITGKATEENGFWDSIFTEFATSRALENVNLVVYPAYIEHQPRILLKALAAGLPVIASAACGLSAHPNLTIIPTGDYDALKINVERHLRINNVAIKNLTV